MVGGAFERGVGLAWVLNIKAVLTLFRSRRVWFACVVHVFAYGECYKQRTALLIDTRTTESSSACDKGPSKVPFRPLLILT